MFTNQWAGREQAGISSSLRRPAIAFISRKNSGKNRGRIKRHDSVSPMSFLLKILFFSLSLFRKRNNRSKFRKGISWEDKNAIIPSAQCLIFLISFFSLSLSAWISQSRQFRLYQRMNRKRNNGSKLSTRKKNCERSVRLITYSTDKITKNTLSHLTFIFIKFVVMIIEL